MATIDSGGVPIAFIDEGGPGTRPLPVLLIHGFASNMDMNWISTGWVRALAAAGYRVVALDNRGHGKSGKLYDPAAYSAAIMAGDSARLLDHLSIPRAHVIGYSMGARIAARLALAEPGRVASLVFGGLGMTILRGLSGTGPIAHALEVPSIDDVKSDTARTFRAFAEQTRSDLKALAACIRGARDPITPEELATISCPVLICVGTRDVIAGSGEQLAPFIPNARYFEIVGRDHMKAVGDRTFKEAVLAFLAGDAAESAGA